MIELLTKPATLLQSYFPQFDMNFEFRQIAGIKEDLVAFFYADLDTEKKKYIKNVTDFSMHLSEEKVYVISVGLDIFSLPEVRKIFYPLVGFISFDYFTLINRETSEEMISYTLASFMDSHKGYVCRLNFFRNSAKKQMLKEGH